MTDKRFTIIADYPNEIGIADNISEDVIVLTHRNLNSESFVNQVCNFLNELHEENTQLKQELEDYKDANVRCCNEYSFFHKEMMKAEKETQRIKTLLHQAYEQERTKLGKSVLRQVIEMIE